jgi:hypothetical protein
VDWVESDRGDTFQSRQVIASGVVVKHNEASADEVVKSRKPLKETRKPRGKHMI